MGRGGNILYQSLIETSINDFKPAFDPAQPTEKWLENVAAALTTLQQRQLLQANVTTLLNWIDEDFHAVVHMLEGDHLKEHRQQVDTILAFIKQYQNQHDTPYAYPVVMRVLLEEKDYYPHFTENLEYIYNKVSLPTGMRVWQDFYQVHFCPKEESYHELTRQGQYRLNKSQLNTNCSECEQVKDQPGEEISLKHFKQAIFEGIERHMWQDNAASATENIIAAVKDKLGVELDNVVSNNYYFMKSTTRERVADIKHLDAHKFIILN